MKKPLTLCIIHQHPMVVLLGMKERGFGAGRWNGFGGKLNPGESIEEAARREFLEEAGVKVHEMEEVGVLDFEFEGNPEMLEVHIFRAENFFGDPEESEEMKPEWFPVPEIPFHSMWPDDPHWFPYFLEGKKFKGRFLFGERDSILEKVLEEVKCI